MVDRHDDCKLHMVEYPGFLLFQKKKKKKTLLSFVEERALKKYYIGSNCIAGGWFYGMVAYLI